MHHSDEIGVDENEDVDSLNFPSVAQAGRSLPTFSHADMAARNGDSPFEITNSEKYHIQDRYDPPRTVEEKHQKLNSLFGIRPFQPAVTKRPLSEHSEEYKKLYQEPKIYPKDPTPTPKKSCSFNLSNYVWVVLCGWWMFLVYGLVGVVLILTFFGRRFGFLCFNLALYYLFPFEKFIVTTRDVYQGEKSNLVADGGDQRQRRTNARDCGFDCLLWYSLSWTILTVTNCIAIVICWMLVFFVPMAKVARVGVTDVLFSKHPRYLKVSKGYPSTQEEVIVCVFQAANRFYYKYSALGINIVLFNMFPFVILALLFAYVPKIWPSLALPDTLMFIICLASVIPLAYYIGLALSSLSAQTSFAVGAVLNATFGSLIELILYFSAIINGSLNNLVQASVTGTLLGMMLLLPGLAMLFGGLKYKEVRFNAASAGVSGVMLLLSTVGAFTPTVFYTVYGNFELICNGCVTSVSTGSYSCSQCTWAEGDLDSDDIYNSYAKPLMYVCAGVLPISYIVGLLFTLKTHAYIIDDPEYIDLEAAAAHGPSGPKWSKLKCLVILVTCTIIFALISEEMVDVLTPTLDQLGISEIFAGLTIIALIPNTAEFVNAIQFALHNNFSMSLEIANSASVQVALIQMPALILFSALVSPDDAAASFSLIFPTLDLFAIMLSVIIMNYVSIDGRANYFIGVALIICYFIFAASFFFIPPN